MDTKGSYEGAVGTASVHDREMKARLSRTFEKLPGGPVPERPSATQEISLAMEAMSSLLRRVRNLDGALSPILTPSPDCVGDSLKSSLPKSPLVESLGELTALIYSAESAIASIQDRLEL